jgi:hypothetical protein
MNWTNLRTFAFICSTLACLAAAYPACAAEEADQQPALEAGSSHRYEEMPPEQLVIAAPPASMPTDEFGHELSYCLLPWDYLPGEQQQQPEEALGKPTHP